MPNSANWRELDPTDIVGQVFGHLTVEAFQSRERYRTRRYQYTYVCVCSCGNRVEAVRSNLVTKHTTSCGCLKRRKGKANPTWRGHGDVSGRVWKSILHHAKDRELSVDITITDAWDQYQAQDGRCALTGWLLTLASLKGSESDRTASLDRIDSSRGYEKGNIQWVHKDVNRSKWDHTPDRFLEICEAVVAQHRQQAPGTG